MVQQVLAPRVRRVVRVTTVEYDKGRRKGEQIQEMRSYFGRQPRRRFYDLGIANQYRLNKLFRAHSDEYWRGYADGLRSTPGRDNIA